jgi:hypothetical protein
MRLTAFDPTGELDEYEHPYGAPQLVRDPQPARNYARAVQHERFGKYLMSVHEYVFCNGARHLCDIMETNPRLFDATAYALRSNWLAEATRWFDCRADDIAFPDAARVVEIAGQVWLYDDNTRTSRVVAVCQEVP